MQLEIDKLKKQCNEITTNSSEDISSREDSVKIFMNYFKGRNDVYPYLSIDKNNPNIKYYIPACANEWKNGVCNKTMGKKCKTCQYRENKPISKETIYKHMYGNYPIGIYPLLENDTCFFLSLDFDDKVTFVVKENGKEKEKYAYVINLEGEKKVGISIVTEYDFESDPKLEMKTKASEAGSSGGLMLSLEIYDKLTSKDLSHGKKVMGTGTIDEDGNVGAIGGVKYKMLGAQKDGADIFFVPKENYDEAKKVYKKNNLSFELVMVETFDEAINYLNNL